MQRITSSTSKAKFYTGNQDIFLRYFNSLEQYQALIRAGNFKKMDEIIAENTVFNLEEFISKIKDENQLTIA